MGVALGDAEGEAGRGRPGLIAIVAAAREGERDARDEGGAEAPRPR
jgi:hypothetical protein